MKLKHLLIGAALGFPVGFVALAAEPVVCAYGVGTSTAIHTHKAACDPGDGGTVVCTPDAGGTCTWNMGSTIMLQCDQDVYVDSTTANNTAGTATSFDQRINFSANNDPYPIYMNSTDQNISTLGVSTAGTCKFITTKRPKPWQ